MVNGLMSSFTQIGNGFNELELIRFTVIIDRNFFYPCNCGNCLQIAFYFNVVFDLNKENRCN
jgi:hypothetical protein